jgi:hypothetical protein
MSILTVIVSHLDVKNYDNLLHQDIKKRFQVFKVVSNDFFVFLVMVLCSLLCGHETFEAIFCIHLHVFF